MNGFAVERILARPAHGLSADDAEILRRMADYLDRNSLKIVWDDGAPGAALAVHVSDDAVRYVLTVDEMRALWTGLKAGRAVDWSSLRRVPRQ
jgi:hypothetical protein